MKPQKKNLLEHYTPKECNHTATFVIGRLQKCRIACLSQDFSLLNPQFLLKVAFWLRSLSGPILWTSSLWHNKEVNSDIGCAWFLTEAPGAHSVSILYHCFLENLHFLKLGAVCFVLSPRFMHPVLEAPITASGYVVWARPAPGQASCLEYCSMPSWHPGQRLAMQRTMFWQKHSKQIKTLKNSAWFRLESRNHPNSAGHTRTKGKWKACIFPRTLITVFSLLLALASHSLVAN